MQAVGPLVGGDLGGRPAARLDPDGDHARVVDADVDAAGDRRALLRQFVGHALDHQVADEAGGRSTHLPAARRRGR